MSHNTVINITKTIAVPVTIAALYLLDNSKAKTWIRKVLKAESEALDLQVECNCNCSHPVEPPVTEEPGSEQELPTKPAAASTRQSARSK